MIKILDRETVRLIAAGEVVTGPSSVVKELIENALDAGATDVEVEISNGGKTLIKVVDNGEGMEKEDLLLCVEKNATSKFIDLDKIATLGFRGEGLYSIASVSNFFIGSRKNGVGYRFKDGLISPMGINKGTVVMVENLFENIPARKKFLGSATWEGKNVEKVLLSYAIAFEKVGFSLRKDGKKILNWPSRDSLERRLVDLFGQEFDLLSGNFKHKNWNLTMFIFRGLITDWNHVFVNKRPVKDRKIISVVKAAQKQIGTNCPFVLFIDCPYEDVDVNVHPAKTEVRFVNGEVYNVVFPLVCSILSGRTDNWDRVEEVFSENKNINNKTPFSFKETSLQDAEKTSLQDAGKTSLQDAGKENSFRNTSGENSFRNTSGENSFRNTSGESSFRSTSGESSFRNTSGENSFRDTSGENSFRNTSGENSFRNTSGENSFRNASGENSFRNASGETSFRHASGEMSKKINETGSFNFNNRTCLENQNIRNVKDEVKKEETGFEEEEVIWEIIGSIRERYIICVGKEGLRIVDQHAAHERIVAESLKEGMKIELQQLMIPIKVSLGQNSNFNEELLENNFIKGTLLDGLLIIDAIPSFFSEAQAKKFIEAFIKEGSAPLDILLRTIHDYGCKHSIRSGDQLNLEERKSLIHTLFKTKNNGFCNHGRRTFFDLSLSRIDSFLNR